MPMIEREYEGEGANKKVVSRTFVCETCGKPTKLIGQRVIAVRMKLPDRIQEHIIVWCGICAEKTGMGKVFG